MPVVSQPDHINQVKYTAVVTFEFINRYIEAYAHVCVQNILFINIFIKIRSDKIGKKRGVM